MEVKIIHNIKYYIIHSSFILKLFDDDDNHFLTYYLISEKDFVKFRYEYYHFIISCLYTPSKGINIKLSNIPIFECYNNSLTSIGTLEYVYHNEKSYTLNKTPMAYLKINFNGIYAFSASKTIENISRLFKKDYFSLLCPLK